MYREPVKAIQHICDLINELEKLRHDFEPEYNHVFFRNLGYIRWGVDERKYVVDMMDFVESKPVTD